MSSWRQGQQREHYFRRAKREGYRSRAAYKLKQINDRYHLIRPGDIVVDLGCAPGGCHRRRAALRPFRSPRSVSPASRRPSGPLCARYQVRAPVSPPVRRGPATARLAPASAQIVGFAAGAIGH